MKKINCLIKTLLALFFIIILQTINSYAYVTDLGELTINKEDYETLELTSKEELVFEMDNEAIAIITSISSSHISIPGYQSYAYGVDIRGKQKGTTNLNIYSVDNELLAVAKIIVTNNVRGVELNRTEYEMCVGGQSILKATLKPLNPDNTNVSWKSDNTNVVTVEQNGVITAVSEGTANITVTTEDGNFTATCKVTVIPELEHFGIIREYGDEINITNRKQEIVLKCSTTPANFKYQNVKYTSLNEKIAQVTSDGKIIPISNGKTTIRAELSFHNEIHRSEIDVNISGIIENINIYETDTIKLDTYEQVYQINYAVTPNENLTDELIIESLNPEIVTVDSNGMLTVVGEGETSIIFRTSDNQIYKSVNVYVEYIRWKGECSYSLPTHMFVGDSANVNLKISPENVINGDIIYYSSNENVIKIDSEGNYIAVGPGEAIIKFISSDYRTEVENKVKVHPHFEFKNVRVEILSKDQVKITWDPFEGELLEPIRIHDSYKMSAPNCWGALTFTTDNYYIGTIEESTGFYYMTITVYLSNGEITERVQKVVTNQLTYYSEYNDEDNSVLVQVNASDGSRFIANKPTWTLSEDGKTYSKIYYENGEYMTNFSTETNSNVPIRIYVYDIREVVNKIEKEYDEKTNTVLVKITAKNEFEDTKPTWILSKDRKTYIKRYTANGSYWTSFYSKNFQKTDNITINIDEIQSGYTVEKEYKNNAVIVKVISKAPFQETKPTWTLDASGKIYSKEYKINQQSETSFIDVNGYQEKIKIEISGLDNTPPELTVTQQYDETTNTVKVIVTSNEILGNTKPTWNLSEDKMQYSKIYTLNGTYTTKFADIYGNEVEKTFTITQIKPGYSIEKIYNKENNTVTIKVTSKLPFQATKPTWALDATGKVYSKVFDANQEYETSFIDISGYSEKIRIEITEIDVNPPELEYTTQYDPTTNTVVVLVSSNESFGKTKPTWTLSEDKMQYSKTYKVNGTYTTKFADIYGNTKELTFTISEIQSGYTIEKEYNEKDNTIIIRVISKLPFQATKPSWTLDASGKIYSKVFNSNQEYETTFIDINGYEQKIQISVNLDKTYMNGHEVAGNIEISKIDLNLAILKETTTNSLETSVTILEGVGLNKVGNTTIMGHNYMDERFFGRLDELTIGDIIFITDKTGTRVAYEIYGTFVTQAADTSWITRDTEGLREISLCTYSNEITNGRLIILASEIES